MNREVQDFWQRALQALRTAEDLIDRDPDTSSSRAYYAAFYAVSALLAFEGQSFSKHTAIERTVHRDLVRTGKWPVEAGAAFSWLANLRHTADYGGGEHAQPGDAEQAIGKARLILNAVLTVTPEPLPRPDGPVTQPVNE
ncbi:MAG: HEPN domain-containing protein [Acidobacteria bacterium]|nr:HEPN domain-containing protein [Acidobacteriota bacterium]